MREFSDLKPFFDIPDSFCVNNNSVKTGAGLTAPSLTAHAFFAQAVWELTSLRQKQKRGNKQFYCIVTGFDTVFTPPFAFWAVTVITFSPVGNGLVKW